MEERDHLTAVLSSERIDARLKEATLEQLAQNVPALLEDAQRERVLITRDGKPLAVIVGIENKDEEDFQLEESPEFWTMIESRRQRPTVPLDEAEARLFAPES